MGNYEIEPYSEDPLDIDEIADALSQLPEEDLQALQEVFTVINQPNGDPMEIQRRLEQIAKGIIAVHAPGVALLMPIIEKARDLSPLRNLTYADNLEFFKELFNPRGLMDPSRGKPLSGQRFLSASRALGRKMRGR